MALDTRHELHTQQIRTSHEHLQSPHDHPTCAEAALDLSGVPHVLADNSWLVRDICGRLSNKRGYSEIDELPWSHMGHSFFAPLILLSADWGAAPANMSTGVCPRSTLWTAPAKPFMGKVKTPM